MVTALVIFGMHRSGTSCLAGMLAAAGAVVPGTAIRNWDNARGHFEALDAVRVNEAVLSASGGHWLQAPGTIQWTAEQALQRDTLLRGDGQQPALIKDPRSILVADFWCDSALPFIGLGIIRHPLASARSMLHWRRMPLAEGIQMWLDHNQALLQLWQRHHIHLLSFDTTKHSFCAQVAAIIQTHPLLDPERPWRDQYTDRLIHHDAATDAVDLSAIPPALWAQALTLYDTLLTAIPGAGALRQQTLFPRAQLAEWATLISSDTTSDTQRALHLALRMLSAAPDPDAIIVPLLHSCFSHKSWSTAHALCDHPRLTPRLAYLLHGKIALAANDPARAVAALREAVTEATPDAEAVLLFPEALHRSGDHAAARAALATAIGVALYPHSLLAKRAEWAAQSGDLTQACLDMAKAITAAPLRKRGRLRTRRAHWLVTLHRPEEARVDLMAALNEDPAWTAAATALQALPAP